MDNLGGGGGGGGGGGKQPMLRKKINGLETLDEIARPCCVRGSREAAVGELLESLLDQEMATVKTHTHILYPEECESIVHLSELELS